MLTGAVTVLLAAACPALRPVGGGRHRPLPARQDRLIDLFTERKIGTEIFVTVQRSSRCSAAKRWPALC